MRATQRHRSARKKKTTRWIVAAILLFSALSCLAPVYASDCSRWVAEYKQGILQRRAARRLQAARMHVVALVHRTPQPRQHPVHRRMGPLEALRRFQVDCGDLDEPTPVLTAQSAVLPVDPSPLAVEFPQQVPPELPTVGLTEIAEVPPLAATPLVPLEPVTTAGPVPEPSSVVLVLTGGLLLFEIRRRKLVTF